MQSNNLSPIPVQINLPKVALIFILGLLSMLMPLSIDMYLPSMPTIASDFLTTEGMVQLTISCYLLGFSIGQLLFGPLTDSYGRRIILLLGLSMFAVSALICGMAFSIEQLITARFFQGVAVAATAIVINALMKDIYKDRDEFSKMMSFVMLISNVAPLLAPIIGGWIFNWFGWHAIFYVLCLVTMCCFGLVIVFIPETLSKINRVKLSIRHILSNFITLFRHRQVLTYMMVGAFSGAGLFSFISFGPFVYMQVHGIAVTHFGYYFAFNIVVMIIMNSINSRFVKRVGAVNMLKLGLTIQFLMSICLFVVTLFNLGFPLLVFFIAGYIGSMSVIGGNGMAIILNYYPYMAGTAASLAGTIRFVVAGLIGVLLAMFSSRLNIPDFMSMISVNSTELVMVGSMVGCNFLATLLFLSLKKDKKR